MSLAKKSLYITILLFILSIIYTVVVNIFAQTFFKESANGSIIYKNETPIGSKHIGQQFTKDNLFHGRPSAYNYNTYETDEEANTLPASGGSNLAVSNPAYSENLKTNIDKLLKENPNLKIEDIPTEMITASGSGLDPHISIEGAMIQVERVAKANNISKEKISEIIKENIEGNIVNVLQLNLAILEYKKAEIK